MENGETVYELDPQSLTLRKGIVVGNASPPVVRVKWEYTEHSMPPRVATTPSMAILAGITDKLNEITKLAILLEEEDWDACTLAERVLIKKNILTHAAIFEGNARRLEQLEEAI